MGNEIIPGIIGSKEIIVTAEKTAIAYGSGTVEVFATPAMIAVMEQTAMESVAEFLAPGFVTVGTEVNIRHIKATRTNETVNCHSKLVEINGKKLVFEVEAFDKSGLIGKGTHTRYIVDKQAFINNIV